MDISEHLEAFARSFVLKSKVDRWVGILTKHKSKNYSQSSKLYDHLDHRFLTRNDDLTKLVSDEFIGVFYDFSDPPQEMSFAEAKSVGDGSDAIFSIEPGKLAVFFFHEYENYVLKTKI